VYATIFLLMFGTPNRYLVHYPSEIFFHVK
jgi:hypothetical protein